MRGIRGVLELFPDIAYTNQDINQNSVAFFVNFGQAQTTYDFMEDYGDGLVYEDSGNACGYVRCCQTVFGALGWIRVGY